MLVSSIKTRLFPLFAKIVDEEKVKPITEELKGIREKVHYTRVMNRRLHNMPFRKIQSYHINPWNRDSNRSS